MLHSPGQLPTAVRTSNDGLPTSALPPNSPTSLRGFSAELTGSLDSSLPQSSIARIGADGLNVTPWQAGPTSPLQAPRGASYSFGHSSSRQHPVSPQQRRAALGSPNTPASLDTYNVLQLLERELAAERAERRDEVSFITKTYEKEIEVWKSRARCASQRLEEERKVLEQDVGSLDSKLAVALEKTRWYEERVQRLEDEVAKRDRSLEEANEFMRRVETTATEAARDREVERHRDRELTHQEYDRLSLQLQRSEQDTREVARNANKEELAAQRGMEALGQALKNAETTTRDLQLHETKALADMRSQETQALTQARRQAEEQIAAARAEVVQYENLHDEAARTHAESRQQSEAAIRNVELERNAERVKLEERVTELRTGHAQLAERGAVALDTARVEHQAQVAKLQERVTDLVEEKLQAQSTVEHVKMLHEHAEQAWEHQICEAGKRIEEIRDGRKEFDTQREQTLQQESEAAMLRRLEVTWLRTELEDLRSRTARDLDEIQAQRSRDNERHEANERTAVQDQKNYANQVRELEAKLNEAEIEHVRLKAALASVEKEEARSISTLDYLRPELAACEAIAQRERDSRKNEDAIHTKLRGDLLAEVQEVEKQKLQIEALYLRLQSELEESEVARSHATHERSQLESEMQQLLRSYRQEQQRVQELDGSMRQHLQLMDREVSDLCSLRAILASSDGNGGYATVSDSVDVDAFLNSFTLPASPMRHDRH